MTDVTVAVGAGSIGQAIARRVSSGHHVVLADLKQENADKAAEDPRTGRVSGHRHDRRCLGPQICA